MTNGNNNNNLIHDPLLQQQQPMDITPITSIDTSSNILSSIEFNHTSQNHQNLFKNFHNTLLNNNDKCSKLLKCSLLMMHIISSYYTLTRF